MRKRGGAFHKPVEYTITHNGMPLYTIQTKPDLFEKGTTYQSIISYLTSINIFEVLDTRRVGTSRVDMHITHADGSTMDINMYNPGGQSEEEIRDRDVITFNVRPIDPFLVAFQTQAQTRKGGKRKLKRKTNRKTKRRLSSA
jgi:hypothetical protein